MSYLRQRTFESFILADEPFAKALGSLGNCVSVSNNLFWKLDSSLEWSITFDERFKVPSVQFFIPDFNLLDLELEDFTFEVLYWVLLYWSYFKTKYSHGSLWKI